MGTLLQDIRYGLRMLRKNPGFTAVAVITLALGIGANTAIFSVVNGVLLRPLPYKNPNRLVWITQVIPLLGAELVSGGDYLRWREQSDALDGLAAINASDSFNLTGRGEPVRIHGARVTAGFFSALGVQPVLGRAFTEEEDRPGTNHFLLLTYGFWQRRFGSDPKVIGQPLALDGENYDVIGIMPASFRFPGSTEVEAVVPMALDPVRERGSGPWSIVNVIGRLKPGVALNVARANLELVERHNQSSIEPSPAPAPAPSRNSSQKHSARAALAPGESTVAVPAPPSGMGAGAAVPLSAPAPRRGDGAPPQPGGTAPSAAPMPQPSSPSQGAPAPTPAQPPETHVKLIPLQERLVGDIRPALLILLGAVGLVLLIACANVGNLLLARATARQKEISIRAALGAGRARLVRQVLTESSLLSVAGGTLGLVLAVWGIHLLVGLTPTTLSGDIFHAVDIGIDRRVLSFTLALSILTSVLFGVVPALAGSKPDLNESLKEGGWSSTMGVHRNRARSTLVVVEMAMAAVLLISAGLLMKSFYGLLAVDPGFQPQQVLTVTVNLPDLRYPLRSPQRHLFFDDLLRRVQSLPGVQSAGLSDSVPLTEFSTMTIGMQAEGQPTLPLGQGFVISRTVVTPDYLRALGMRLKRGRQFTEQDSADAPKAAILNEMLAHKFWLQGDPVGKRIQEAFTWITVVGVVADVKHEGLDTEIKPEFYVPFAQEDSLGFMHLAVRTFSDPITLAAAVRKEVQSMDRDLPIYNVQTMEQRLSGSVSPRRFNMVVLGLFAGLALTLAAVGIYSVVSYSVTQRTHEFGIRIALGADRRDVLKLVVRQGLALALVGVAAGLTSAFAFTRFLSTLLYAVNPSDPWTFGAVSLVLIAVALLASFVPARRATKVDPMVALRYE